VAPFYSGALAPNHSGVDNQDYRAIIYSREGVMVGLYVDRHDDAYRWACGRRMDYNPVTGAVELIALGERHEEEPREIPPPAAERPAAKLFAAYSDADMASIGLHAELLSRVRALEDEAALDAMRSETPPAVHDGLIGLASGLTLDEVKALLEPPPSRMDSFADAMSTEQSGRFFRLVESDEELERMLGASLEEWRIFLHPTQRKLVTRNYTGPAMVRGGAGTGKTVVAMHRAMRLAAGFASTGGKVLFTTFTSNLAADIDANLDRLCGIEERKRIEVKNLDRWVGEFLRKEGYPRKIVYGGEETERLWDDVIQSYGSGLALSREFIVDEWRQVIQANGITDEGGYVRVSRAGRGTPIDRKTRMRLWKVFEAYRAHLDEEGIAEQDDAFRDARRILNSRPALLPYRAVVVDEAQDMGAEAFRLIRAIVPPRQDGDDNSLFIVGDAHQRIYQRKASMQSCGIDVRGGRSARLKINYRTSNEIRNWATAVLKGVAVDDMDGGTDTLAGTVSRFHGPSPRLEGRKTFREEIAVVAEWVNTLAASGCRPEDVCVLARTAGQVAAAERELKRCGHTPIILVANENDDRGVPGIRIATMHRAKGLEFTAVALVGMSASEIPPKKALEACPDAAAAREVEARERSLIHVAATRAKRWLLVTWSGALTPLI
ncbi:MAG: UvrD-helicase domain-containing protein, partial [Rhodospirillaceae bacterium]